MPGKEQIGTPPPRHTAVVKLGSVCVLGGGGVILSSQRPVIDAALRSLNQEFHVFPSIS